jgi:hypothetical protein
MELDWELTMADRVVVDPAEDDILTIVLMLLPSSRGMKACVVQWAPDALAPITSINSLGLLK